MKCPNCGAMFILKGDSYQCKYCGYVEYIDKDTSRLNEIDNNTEEEYNNKKIEIGDNLAFLLLLGFLLLMIIICYFIGGGNWGY